MKLKRLIVQGFKSFKDRTTIVFDDGITGIVGPNGCGKSNIVDALFWVMGEQSAKHLRGNSMKDLIFAGSSKYQPAAWAEVSLVLENTHGKHIHIGSTVSSPTEIQLTRKLYRNGETEYRINGQPCRMKDIQEVFMDTGAGAKSYSIIAQGEINRLVQSKPEERRVMIEEVAGITKFKVRKKESLKKIEQTQANLLRLNDLQVEIEKNLKNLQKQAEKAERARELKEKIKRHDLIVHSHRVFDLMKEYKESKTALNGLVIDLNNWKIRKDTVEVGLEEERFKLTEVREQIEDLQKEFNDMSRSLAGAEEKLNYTKKQIKQKEELISAREKEVEEIKKDIANRQERLKVLEAEEQQLEDFAREDHDTSDQEELVESLKEELELRESSLRELLEQVKQLKADYDQVDKEVFKNTSRLEEFAGNLQDITAEIEGLEKQYSGVSGQIAEEREAANNAEEEAISLKKRESELKVKLDQAQAQVRASSEKLQSLSKTKIKAESTLQSLKEIAASLEGVKEGASAFIGQVEEGTFSLLGTLVNCSSDDAKAVNALLREYMEMLVASGDAAPFYQWVKSNSNLGIDLITTSAMTFGHDEETVERLRMRCGEVRRLSSLVQVPEQFCSVNSLFTDRYVVEKLDEEIARSLASDLSFSALVSSDGRFMVRQQHGVRILSVRGNEEVGGGVVERNNRIQQLEAECLNLASDFDMAEKAVETAESSLSAIRCEYDMLRDQAAAKNAEAQVKKTALEAKLSSYQTTNARLEILKNRKNEISKARVDLLDGEDKLNRRLEQLRKDIEEKDDQLDQQNDQLVDLKSRYQDERDALRAKQVAVQGHQDRVRSVQSQLEDTRGQLERHQQKMESNQLLIDQYGDEIEAMTVESEELSRQNHQSASALADKEDVLAIAKDQLAELMITMQDRENEVKKLARDIGEAEKKINKFELTTTQNLSDEEVVTRDIFEKYRIDLRKVLGSYLEFSPEELTEFHNLESMYYVETESGLQQLPVESYEFNRRYGQDLKESEHKLRNYKGEYQRLGEINWQAIEDYERQKMRFDFLQEQEVKLRQSLTDLEEAIAHIDEKSRERFKIAFDEVDARFQKVFPIIFGGGEARLEITGDVNDPECGVDIVAKPPGKKMQNINLMSGGEKAMTAVSLIFSIFLVKPSPFCLLDEVDAPLDDANVGRFNELLREMSKDSQFILITHNKKTMEMNDTLYGVTMQEPGVSKAVHVQLH